jgi:NAD(P)-dependent dehydrogenase (short-subunit alcohol dehydrogenase family)
MNMWSLEDARAIVTGDGRGIGAAIGAGMLELGTTMLGGARSRKDLDRLRHVNLSAANRLHIFGADLTDASQRDLVIKKAKELLGDAYVLVNNAGVTFKAPASHPRGRCARSRFPGHASIHLHYRIADRRGRRISRERILVSRAERLIGKFEEQDS